MVGQLRSRHAAAGTHVYSMHAGRVISAILGFCLMLAFPVTALAQAPEIISASITPQIDEGGQAQFSAEGVGGSGSCSLSLQLKPKLADDSELDFIASVSGAPDKTLNGSTTLPAAQYPAGEYEAVFVYSCDGEGGQSDEVRLDLLIVAVPLVITEAAITPEICPGEQVEFDAMAEGGAGTCTLALHIKPKQENDSAFTFIASVSGPATTARSLSGSTTLAEVHYPPGLYESRFSYTCDAGSGTPAEVRQDVLIRQGDPALIEATSTPALCLGGLLEFRSEGVCGLGECSLDLNIKPESAGDSDYTFLASVSNGPGKVLLGSTTLSDASFDPGLFDARFRYSCSGEDDAGAGTDVLINPVNLAALPNISSTSVSPQLVEGGMLEYSAQTADGVGSCDVVLEAKPAGADDSQFAELASGSGLPGLALQGAVALSPEDYPAGQYEARFRYACDGSGCGEAEARLPFEVVQPIARFRVTKDFTDDNPAEVTVDIVCNTGLPLQQSYDDLDEGGVVEFVVDQWVNAPGSWCEITEATTAGYETSYVANGGESGTESCYFDGAQLAFQTNTCHVTNEPGFVAIEVSKLWLFDSQLEVADVDTRTRVNVVAQGPLKIGDVEQPLCPNSSVEYCGSLEFSGVEDQAAIHVKPGYLGARVEFEEELGASYAEPENTCGKGNVGQVTVFPGEGASCAFTNTVFFEGIPALNRQAILLLALLTLGIGLVGVRRLI